MNDATRAADALDTVFVPTLTPVHWDTIFDPRGWNGCSAAKQQLQRLAGQTVTALDCINAPELSDADAVSYTLWLLWHTDIKTARWLACDCAERVLPIFEQRIPGDKRPRECIETVRRWCCGEATEAEMLKAAAAADAAWAAERKRQRAHIAAVLSAAGVTV
jgi:hypothetical protein